LKRKQNVLYSRHYTILVYLESLKTVFLFETYLLVEVG